MDVVVVVAGHFVLATGQRLEEVEHHDEHQSADSNLAHMIRLHSNRGSHSSPAEFQR